ncbi:MAG: hypothetical protein HYW93_04890 [Thaumarchaeota archaeon]|nr:hypothetical protein [Nitrososphaerota archaeon]
MDIGMVNITISLPEQTVRRLRRAVRVTYGGRKGALSGFIKEAIDEHFESLQSEPPRTFRATDKERMIAEGSSLEELASRLGELGVDPRSVRIISSTKISPVAKAGFRARPS